MSDLPPPQDDNPYAAPSAELVPQYPGESGEAEAIRREYFKHESSVRSVGLLFFLFVAILVVAGIALASRIIPPALEGEGADPLMVFLLALFSALAVLYAFIGVGLRQLRPWGRWLGIALMMLGILGNTFTIIQASANDHPERIVRQVLPLVLAIYILYLLASRKGAMVFSPEYRAAIAQTPHIRYRTSLLIKILGGFLLLLLLLMIPALIAALSTGRGQ